MNDLGTTVVNRLKQANWSVDVALGEVALPDGFAKRYAWVPGEVLDVVRGLDLAVAPDEKQWLVTGGIIRGTADVAFAADEFERISLDACAGDDKELTRIREFWDTHLCIAMSVKSGYSCYALAKSSLAIVVGHEPEFEDASDFAESFTAFIDRLCTPT